MPTAEKTLIRVGHSPDPDDAFMFHALANGKIDTGPYEFTHQLQDIQTLNQRALNGELELSERLSAADVTAWLAKRCPDLPKLRDRLAA